MSLVLTGAAHAQVTLPAAPVDASAPQNIIDPNAILINIDGRGIVSDPPPLLQSGRTFVPLRGVLENLGARVNYVAAERRVDIARDGQNVQLFLGTTRAILDGKTVEVEKPLLVNGRAFVPLRAVSELFGLKVSWLPTTRTVAIYTGAPISRPTDHRAELAAAGPFGVAIDFTAFPVESVPSLLDGAKSAGAGLIKFRFDWGTLEPSQGAAFEWNFFDTIVREARARDLKIVGILGDTAPWASVASSSFGNDKRQSPPRADAYPAWSNYVARVVGRYGNDVSAWQVWENPNGTNFRSVDRNYRKLAQLAITEAKRADAKAIVTVAEPGGVDLDSVRGYNQNGLTAAADGVAVYPLSRFQPSALATPEAFLRPYARLQETLKLSDRKTRDYWVGGLSFPVALPFPGAKPSEDGQNALELFTPTAQADYLLKSMALSLAAGSEKAFWNQLRDAPDPQMLVALQAAATTNATAPVEPPVPESADATAPETLVAPPTVSALRVAAPRDGVVQDEGLQRADGTLRPSFAAFQALARNLGDKPYRGNLSFNSDLVALLFDNKTSGDLVVWSPNGAATLALNSSGASVNLPGAQFVSTRPDSLVTDATGTVIAPPDGVLKVGTRPIYITHVASTTVQDALANPVEGAFVLQDAKLYQDADSVSAELTSDGAENGITWRKYAEFGSVARSFYPRGERRVLTTQSQRDIFDLKSQRPFIYFDVADDWIYDSPGEPLTLTVEVYAPALSDATKALGFRVEYDGAQGNRSTKWQPLVPGSGWQKFDIPLPDAQFAGSGGYDFLINVGASAADISFGSVTLTRGAPPAEAVVVGP